MKKYMIYFAAIAMAFMVISCGKKPEKTIENLKTAITGEANASAKYAKFSEQAANEGLTEVAALFAATSKAESIHAANHQAVLAELGVTDFEPVINDVEVKTTLENLMAARAGEEEEFNVMYPGFMTTAKEEKAEKAVNTFDWANTAEQRHAAYYTEAIEMLQAAANDTVATPTTPVKKKGNKEIVVDTVVVAKTTFNTAWLVCPTCGDTYKQTEIEAACKLCGAPIDSFIKF